MKLSTQDQISLFTMCLQQGVDISTKKISLCNLSNHRFSEVKPDRGYQVHTDKWSRIYENLEDAVAKFVELKNGFVPKNQGV